MRPGDGHSFNNISATTAAFKLDGGLYQFNVVAGSWGSGNVCLYGLGPDQTTWLSVDTSLTANGGQTFYLQPGQYQIQMSGVTGVYASIYRVPGD